MFTPYRPRYNKTRYTPYSTSHTPQYSLRYITPQYTTPEYTTPVQYMPTEYMPPQYLYVYPATPAPVPLALALAPPSPSSQQPTRQPDYSAIYESDEFRMYIFKIKKCPKNKRHDWTSCPYVHQGEKARRRDPRKYKYAPITCPYQRNGNCKNGDTCEFAHGIFEYWLHPARYRTRVCATGAHCQRSVCFFAHNAQELRSGNNPKCQCQQAHLTAPDQEEITEVPEGITEVPEEIPTAAESTPNSTSTNSTSSAAMFPSLTGSESSKRGGIDWDVVEKLKGLTIDGRGGRNIWSDEDMPDGARLDLGWSVGSRESVVLHQIIASTICRVTLRY